MNAKTRDARDFQNEGLKGVRNFRAMGLVLTFSFVVGRFPVKCGRLILVEDLKCSDVCVCCLN